MLILIKLLFPAKKHIAENPTTAWAGEMYSIFVLLLNVMAFLDSGSCGNSVDQGVFSYARPLLYPTKFRVVESLLVLFLIKASLFCLQANTALQTKSCG